MTLRDYLTLTKFPIVMSVLAAAILGFFAGQRLTEKIHFSALLTTLAGLFFLSSGACALNQWQEVELDKKMPRTAARPLPSGRVRAQTVLLMSLVFALLGIGFLSQVNIVVVLLGLSSIVLYNLLYTLWWKPHWPFAAVPGALPGALPVLIGFAASQRVEDFQISAGLYLFVMMFFWQMPHFWTLSLKFQDDYSRGEVPTLPVAYGQEVTRQHILLWSLGYAATALIAPLFFKVQTLYLLVAIGILLRLLWLLRRFIDQPQRAQWLQFFVWVNLSLGLFFFALVLDIWSVYLWVPLLTEL